MSASRRQPMLGIASAAARPSTPSSRASRRTRYRNSVDGSLTQSRGTTSDHHRQSSTSTTDSRPGAHPQWYASNNNKDLHDLGARMGLTPSPAHTRQHYRFRGAGSRG